MKTMKAEEFLRAVDQHQRYLSDPDNRLHDPLFFQNVRIEKVDARNLDLNVAILDNVLFENSDFYRASFQHASFKNVRFANVKLDDANFSKTKAHALSFDHCSGNGVSFVRSHSTLLRIVNKSDFKFADFHKAWIPNVRITDSRLANSCFVSADLYSIKAIKADLSESGFQLSDLQEAIIVSSDLRQANFAKADFQQAQLTFTKIDDANFHDAVITGLRLTGVDTALAKTLMLHPSYSARNLKDVSPDLAASGLKL